MKMCWLGLVLVGLCGFATQGWAQTAPEMKSASPEARPGENTDQKAQRLLAEMLTALGGDAWLNKQYEYIEGQTGRFFRGQPTGQVTRLVEYIRFANGTTTPSERIDFLTARGVILPEGSKRDLVHLWTATHGYEYTYKGRTELPAEQVRDYLRRRQHSIEEVMRTWVKAPGVMIVYEGPGMRDRHAVDKVTVLAANNDAVTLELDQTTHLPIERSYQTRNEQFKDLDFEEEVYGDWRAFQGVMTPMNVTLYHNADMASETFYKKIEFNRPTDAQLFDEDRIKPSK